jgi:hypothetical protein
VLIANLSLLLLGMVASEMQILWKTKLSLTLQDQEFMCPPINLILEIKLAVAAAVVLLLLWEMRTPFDCRFSIDYCVSPPQYDLLDLPQNHLPELRGPDSGISAIIPADKYASLRQAGQAEHAPVPSSGYVPVLLRGATLVKYAALSFGIERGTAWRHLRQAQDQNTTKP